MTWNAALVVSYTTPIPDREATAMEVFAGALTTFGTLAADGKCAEPEAFSHLMGGGMMIVKTESITAAYEILALDDVRRIVNTAVFSVGDFGIEVMATGERLMANMALYTTIGVELGYI